MTANEKNKSKKKKAGSGALKKTKINVRIVGEDFNFEEENNGKIEQGSEKEEQKIEIRTPGNEASKKEEEVEEKKKEKEVVEEEVEEKEEKPKRKRISIGNILKKEEKEEEQVEKEAEPASKEQVEEPVKEKEEKKEEEEKKELPVKQKKGILRLKASQGIKKEPDPIPEPAKKGSEEEKKQPEPKVDKTEDEIRKKIKEIKLTAGFKEDDEVDIRDDGHGGVIVTPKGGKMGKKFFSFFKGKRREKTKEEIIESHSKKSFLKKIGAENTDVKEEQLPKEENKEKKEKKKIISMASPDPDHRPDTEQGSSTDPSGSAQDKSFDSAQDKSFDSAQDKSFDSAQDKEIKFKKIKMFKKRSDKEDVEKEKPLKKREQKDSEKEEDVPPRPKSIGLYRKISFFFIFLTILLIAGVFFLMFVSMTITVTPKSETINEKLITNVFDEDKNKRSSFAKEAVPGEVVQIDVADEQSFKATGAEIISQEIKGEVRIINEYNYSQPLVASTRLLTPDDKLFRIKETVTIPAGGEVKVAVRAEEPSEEMAVAPTRFTIPGLPAFQQDKIYAVNDDKFIYETQVRKYVQQTDIDQGLATLKGSLKEKVERQYGKEYKGNDNVIYEIDKNSMEVDLSAKVNDEADQFDIRISSLVNIVAFKTDSIKDLAKEKLISVIPNSKKLVSIKEDEMEYSLSNYNFDQGVATVEVSFSAETSLDETKGLIDKKKLVGLNEDQIVKFLESEEKFDDFQIEFFPSFIRKAPQLVDRIKVQISK